MQVVLRVEYSATPARFAAVSDASSAPPGLTVFGRSTQLHVPGCTLISYNQSRLDVGSM